MSAGQADQEARRAAEMVFTILGERVDQEEAMGGVWLGLVVRGTVRRGEAGGAGEWASDFRGHCSGGPEIWTFCS